jgi:uracil-DNA glycosylase
MNEMLCHCLETRRQCQKNIHEPKNGNKMNDPKNDFWNEQHLSSQDDLNEEMWNRSPKIQVGIQHPIALMSPDSIGAQQAMAGENILPWVPDLVGKNWKDPSSLIIVGSTYAGFIKEYSTRPFVMSLGKYISSNDPYTFQKHFLNDVVKRDNGYYGPIAVLAESFGNLSNLALFDLCRASFVQRGSGQINRGDKSGDTVVKKGAKIYEQYVEFKESESWLWKRLTDGKAKCVVALGSIAEHGLLRLYKKNNFSVRQYKNHGILQLPVSQDGRWVFRFADKYNQCTLGSWIEDDSGDWWVIRGSIKGIEREWYLLPVYHPARYQGNDSKYIKSKKVLDIMKMTI